MLQNDAFENILHFLHHYLPCVGPEAVEQTRPISCWTV